MTPSGDVNKLPNYPAYPRQFERQTRDQHRATVLEAKLSHDLAYYRYFDGSPRWPKRAGVAQD